MPQFEKKRVYEKRKKQIYMWQSVTAMYLKLYA